MDSRVLSARAPYINLQLVFFFQTQRRPYCGPRRPLEAGTVQTDVGERLCGISKTVFADSSSRWLRGEDAGSPGAFLHLLYVDCLIFMWPRMRILVKARSPSAQGIFVGVAGGETKARLRPSQDFTLFRTLTLTC